MVRTGVSALAGVLGMLALLSVSFAEEKPAPAPVPVPVIDSIRIFVRDVFEDEDEDEGAPSLWPYKLANQLHLDTRESVIRRELLFHEGEPLDREAIEQTERNLRALPFLREARVDTVPGDTDGRIGVRVVVSDSWSAIPEGRLAKVGNEWVWGFGFTEENLLGRGKQLQAMHTVDLEREETFLAYRDPRLAGTRTALSTLYSSATDGHLASVGVGRPFYSLDTRWSFRVGYEDVDRLDPLYEEGERVEDLRHRRKAGEMELARSVRRTEASALRLHLGYGFSRDDVDLERRQFGMLRVGVTTVSHHYRAVTHVNRFERTEDINLGTEAAAFFGLSAPALGLSPVAGGSPSTREVFSWGRHPGRPATVGEGSKIPSPTSGPIWCRSCLREHSFSPKPISTMERISTPRSRSASGPTTVSEVIPCVSSTATVPCS
jgi:hypothetical protein